MTVAGESPFGPNSTLVLELLNWIDRGALLRFGGPLSGPFVPVFDFDTAKSIAHGLRPGGVDWTAIRDNADAMLYEIGLLDSSDWAANKVDIEELLSVVADKVVVAMPAGFPGILDDVIADLHVCARSLAVKGTLDPFHQRLWNAYLCGGWPCGCTGEDLRTPDHQLVLEGRSFYVYWNVANPSG